MAEPEKGVERDKKYRDGTENIEKRGGKPGRIPLLYKQHAARGRNNGEGSEGALLGNREHALALGCYISGRYKHNNRQNCSAEPEYHPKMVSEYIKTGGIIHKD